MKKTTVETFLLSFAIASIIWCTLFAYIIGDINKESKIKIELLEKKCK